MKVPFKAKVRKITGDSYGITIPRRYVEDGHYKEGDTYRFEGTEIPEEV